MAKQSLEKLAKSFLADEKSDVSLFQRKTRILQSMWRKERGYEAGEYKGKTRGNYLPMPWAQDTLANFLSDTTRRVVAEEVLNQTDSSKFYAKPRIFNNLLSSQPLCFNFFAELKEDLYLATKVFRQICPHRVDTVTGIQFEYTPGRKDPTYTGDCTAFDVLVEYANAASQKGFIGIEVKYHENLRNTPPRMADRYFDIAAKMGCFKRESIDILQRAPLEQLWRIHLLVGSLLYSVKDFYRDGFFLFLYPRENVHCKEAVNKYRTCLTIDRTFQALTLERVAEVIKEHTLDRWIDEVINRYLDFEKIKL